MVYITAYDGDLVKDVKHMVALARFGVGLGATLRSSTQGGGGEEGGEEEQQKEGEEGQEGEDGGKKEKKGKGEAEAGGLKRGEPLLYDSISTCRNQTQETNLSVQSVPGFYFYLFDFTLFVHRLRCPTRTAIKDNSAGSWYNLHGVCGLLPLISRHHDAEITCVCRTSWVCRVARQRQAHVLPLCYPPTCLLADARY